tara:strand:- start:279 stop:623 length:345 start_codon:yes stop_codon:yes gene_type:complete
MTLLDRKLHGNSNNTTSTSINVETIRDKLKTNKSLKFNVSRGNSFEVTIASKNDKDLVMCIYVNNHIISSWLKVEHPDRKTDSEQGHFNFQRYQNIPEIEFEISRLQNDVDKVN